MLGDVRRNHKDRNRWNDSNEHEGETESIAQTAPQTPRYANSSVSVIIMRGEIKRAQRNKNDQIIKQTIHRLGWPIDQKKLRKANTEKYDKNQKIDVAQVDSAFFFLP